MNCKLHIVGAGLAGLAAGVAAARAGAHVVLHESANHAGGRCRSFRDERLDRIIDNGSHLVLGANKTVLAYAAATGGLEAMAPCPASFPFVDLATGARWDVTPRSMPLGLGEIFKALGLPWVRNAETVESRLGDTRSYARFWVPMCEAILNTEAASASASMFAWTMRKALLGGAAALIPWVFPLGLSTALVAPALATLGSHGAETRFRRRLIKVGPDALVFDDHVEPLSPDDRVILALPPWALGQVMPDSGAATMPTRPIVNAHFRLQSGITLPGHGHFLGLVNASGHWLFSRGDVLSVTVSAAQGLAERPAEEVAVLLWDEAARAMGQPPSALPPYRIMKEKRATLAHDRATIGRRPGPRTALPQVFLAGDWLESPWPCTIEAAISSGLTAARLALGRPELAF